MKLVIEKGTHIVFNTFEYTGEGSSAENYTDSWTDSQGDLVIPSAFEIVEVENLFFTERLELQDGFRSEFRYNSSDGNLYEVQIPEPHLIAAKIKEYTDKLAGSDYKVIKAYEASLVGGPVPYNFNDVHAERQAIRDKINELENLLKSGGGVK